MASDPESVWQLELDPPAVSALVAQGRLADDFQYACGECRYRMADAGFYDCSRPSACRWRKRGQQNEALGRSRGGFSTQIHAVCDALGHPLRFILTGGQAADCRQALALLDGLKADAVLADKGYDANYII